MESDDRSRVGLRRLVSREKIFPVGQAQGVSHMTIAISSRFLVLGCLLAITPDLAQQTDNNALRALPPPGRVVVDGKLDDWDLSGQMDV